MYLSFTNFVFDDSFTLPFTLHHVKQIRLSKVYVIKIKICLMFPFDVFHQMFNSCDF